MPGCKGLANSRRSAEKNQHAPLHHTEDMASCSLASACGLASIYDYVHVVIKVTHLCLCVSLSTYCFSVFMPHMKSLSFVAVVLGRRRGLRLVCRICHTYSLPPAFSFMFLCLPLDPQGLSLFCRFLIFCALLLPPTRFVCCRVLWCDLPSVAAATASAVMQLPESDAPFVRVFEPRASELCREPPQTLSGMSKGHHAFDMGGGRQWTRLSVTAVLCGTCGSVPSVCELIRVRDDAVRP